MKRRHSSYKKVKFTSDEYRDTVRKKDRIFKGVLPVRFATKDVDGNDIVIDSDGKVEDNNW